MKEYCSIINSSRAPRKYCIAQKKYDGSNIRAKYTSKEGFCLFGTRTQLIDETTEFWNEIISIFQATHAKPLTELFKTKDFRDFREITVFGEFFGENSFAGRHEAEPHKIVVFDVLLGHKQHKLIPPREFHKVVGSITEVPEVVYEGNLSDAFIADVRNGSYGTDEGVICKGIEKTGAFFGGTWMCKIKTMAYLEKLKQNFADDWEKYAE
jgi:hypothetical protein